MRLFSVFACFATFLLAACGGEGAPDTPGDAASPSSTSRSETGTSDIIRPLSIADVIQADPSLSTFWDALELTGLADEISAGDLTIFAPRNAAFEALPEAASIGVLSAPENIETLKALLQLHLVKGVYAPRRLEYTDQSLETLFGRELEVVTTGSVTTVGGAVLLRGMEPASDGHIYVIDALVLPKG